MPRAPRYGKKKDGNHAEIRELFRDCGCVVLDTSDLGATVGDLIVQYQDPATRNYELKTWIVEVKTNKKAKLTEAQKKNPLKLIRIESRADVFDLLGQSDWELM